MWERRLRCCSTCRIARMHTRHRTTGDCPRIPTKFPIRSRRPDVRGAATPANSDRFVPPILRAARLTKIVTSGEEPLTILDDVSFDVAPGASVAIVGASGSGKTTLLGLLAGLDRPSDGEVWLDGVALSTQGEDARAALRQRLLGFVFQSFQLLPALTALE